jgi:hypothetical protein
MTCGAALSARERERERALLGRLGGTRPGASERGRGQLYAGGLRVLLGRAGGEEEKRPELRFCFSFFKNMNSSSFCLFQ